MKQKGLTIGSLLAFVSFASWIGATSVELPLDPDLVKSGKAKVAVSVDFSDIYERQLGSSGSGLRSVSSGQITDSNQFHGKILYALNQYLNLYAKAGLTNWSEELLFNDGGKTAIKFNSAPSWGVGSTGGIKFASGKWQVFYDLEYLSAINADVSSIVEAVRTITSRTGKADLNQFHVALGLGHEFHTDYEWAERIFPYIGVKYSLLTVEHGTITWSGGGTDFSITDDVDEDNNWGLVAGLRVGNYSNTTLRLEGRLFDELALTLAVDYRF